MIEHAIIGAIAGASYGIVGFLDRARHNGEPFDAMKMAPIVIISGLAGGIVGWQSEGIPLESEIMVAVTMLTSLGAGKIVERLLKLAA